MILDSSSRSVNKVRRIWFNERICNVYTCFTIGAIIPVLHLFVPQTGTREAKLSPACNSFFWNTFSWNTTLQDSIDFLPLEVSVRKNRMNEWRRGPVYTANDSVRTHITRRICAKSSCCLEDSTANQSTLVDMRFCLYQPISSDRCRNWLQSVVALLHPSKQYLY